MAFLSLGQGCHGCCGPFWPHIALFVGGMIVAKRKCRSDDYLKGKLIMKKLVSFLLGAMVLFGAASLGLQSATANAKERHDKNYQRHHKHHRHHRHHKNKLSY